MFGYSKEAVRVKVKKCEGKLQSELRKFSVDPQITSLEVLLSILVKAFDIKSDFTLSYRSADDYGQENYLPLLSDWDLDAAFLKAHNIALTQHSEPCVQLRVDMKPFAEASEDWEPPSMSPPIPRDTMRDQPTVAPPQQPEKQEISGFQGLIMNQVEKTFNMVSRALNLYDDPNTPPRPPLSDSEFRSFLNTVGQITNTTKLREVIYCGGIDPSLRKVVWKHILNVYPDGMTGKERMDYIKKKANEYYALRAKWKDCIQKGKVDADLAYVTSMVRKDVLRTDRHHNFYAGSDDNQNIASLFNILTTYALNHPRVSYCQGMSDLASPLLVTMRDEAHAYICLCALMARLHSNFLLDGETMTLKFAHLTESLQVYDPDFYTYLKSQQADDLLFCYRWLLLEMKREFAFEDALRMLEVLWASLPPGAPPRELPLRDAAAEPGLEPPPSPRAAAPRDNAYTKVCAMRRQSSSFNLAAAKPGLATCRHTNHSLDENLTRDPERDSSLERAVHSSYDAASQAIESKADDDDVATNKENALGEDLKLHVRKNIKSVSENEKKTLNSANLLNGKSHSNGKDTSLGGQIRLLRDKISVHNNKFDGANDTDSSNRPKVRMIKNLNEFLNFATGSDPNPARHERLQRAHSAIETTKEYPKITLTKMSMDESDLGKQTVRDSLMSKINRNIYNDANDGSSPDDSQEYYPMTTSMTRELRLELEHLDRQVFGPSYANRCSMICDSPTDSTGTEERGAGDRPDIKENPEPEITPDKRVGFGEAPDAMKRSPLPETVKGSARSAEDIYLWENPLHLHTPPTRASASCPHTPDEQAELELDDSGDIFELHSGRTSVTPIRLLRAAPAPAPAGDSDSAELALDPAPDSARDRVSHPAPDSARDPASHPVPDSARDPASHVASDSARDPVSHPVPDSARDPASHAAPDSARDPASHPVPDSARDPASHPAPDSASHPVPDSARDPASHLEPDSAQDPAAHSPSDPAPDSGLDLAPETPRADASKSHKFFSNMSQELENAKRNCESLLNAKPANLQSVASTINNFQKKYEALKPPAARAPGAEPARGVAGLPPPGAFGGGNPFLMFLCLTLLLQHRDYVMRNRMDYNELAMHFDKMVRKHDVTRVLNQARHMYALYLKHHARDRAA